MEKAKTFIEFLKSLYSRKLLVFIVATVLLIVDTISQENWLIIAISYMSVNTVLSVLDTLKSSKLKDNLKPGKELLKEEGSV